MRVNDATGKPQRYVLVDLGLCFRHVLYKPNLPILNLAVLQGTVQPETGKFIYR